MNLRQLRFIAEVARQGLNVSAAAESLYTSQPGVSKQIRQLEDELGVQIFERRGKQLTRVTPAGRAIIEYANRALIEVEAIKEAAREYRDPGMGRLSIATSHAHARYVLPGSLQAFRQQYPQVDIHLHQGTPEQLAEMITDGVAEFVIAAESLEHFDDLLLLPCYQWQRGLMVPKKHPLCRVKTLDLAAVAAYPLVTYGFDIEGRHGIDKLFRSRNLIPNIALTASDADVIKTYVRQGAGVGILPSLSYDPVTDTDLVLLSGRELFEINTTYIGFRRGTFLRQFMYDFMAACAPHLRRELIDTLLRTRTKGAMRSLFLDIKLPLR